MMYLSMNIIVAIICDTNIDVRREVFYQDWLSLAASFLKQKMRRMKRRTRYIFNPQIDDTGRNNTL